MSKQRKKHPNLVKTRKRFQKLMRDKDHANNRKSEYPRFRQRLVGKLGYEDLMHEWDKEDEEIRYEQWEETARQYRM